MQCLGGCRVQPIEGYAMNGWWFPPSMMIVSSTYVDLSGGIKTYAMGKNYLHHVCTLVWSLVCIIILSSFEVQDDYTLIKFSVAIDERLYLSLCIRFYILVWNATARYLSTCSV